MITKKSKIASRLFFQITVLIALGFSFASCSSSPGNVFAYPNATLYEGGDVGVLWRKALPLPPPDGVMIEYEGKAYSTTDSLDNIILYYQRSLSNWDYLGRGTDPETKEGGAIWKKNDDLLSIYYLSLPDHPCCFLLVMHTHFQRPFYTTPLFYLGLFTILIALLFVIFKKRLKKE